jgi:predicted short-subunit dehydrogenase-like oxidoreductase (DUF2520 family)
MRTLNIIGAGHVGRVLGKVLAARGAFTVQDVLTRSQASAQEAVAFIGSGRAVDSYAALRPADSCLLAVSDDQIATACASLAAAMALRGVLVWHCSGALASDALAPARVTGAVVASAHPIRSFADPAAVARDFAGTFCGVEGDAAALEILNAALTAAGAQVVQIDPAAKTVYHAAAVFASNYLVTVLDAALQAYQAAGIPEPQARALAEPLATETLANVFRLGPARALSGPIARGDHLTVEKHERALEQWNPRVAELYRALVPPTAALASRKRGGQP